MEYQLVLQLQGASLTSFDALISLEGELSLQFSDVSEVDGHDMGCNEANIFILTSNPLAAFSQARPVLERHNQLSTVKAAYRLLTEDAYCNLWPAGSEGEFLVA
ncbi:hypothetical protein LP420_04925 [Massilia sp. B-10]|nr:hypothetical protein LP420_04925 [Massilia sp. B-10]UUZ55151.1 hypothetical protein LP419_04650 [Massilia sp. H-1]